MKVPLTKQQKEEKRLRDNLRALHNRIISAHNFHEITTWEDVKQYTPCDSKTGPVSFAELKAFLQTQTDELEKEIAGELQATSLSAKVQQGDISVPDKQDLDTPIQQQKNETAPVPIHTEPPAQDEGAFFNKSSYGLMWPETIPPDTFAYWFQKKAVKEILDKVLGFDISTCKTVPELKKKYQVECPNDKQLPALLLLASTGSGKTFMNALTHRLLHDIDFQEGKTVSHIPRIIVTRASIVEQTKRVFKNAFNLGLDECEVINIEQLRSRAGQLWVTEKKTIVEGNEVWWWEWKKHINPPEVSWDECQALKNDGSIQHNIAVAYNDLPSQKFQLFISATPFTRVCEAKCFAIATGKDISKICGKLSGFPKGTTLNKETWPTYAQIICGEHGKPDEYNESAVDRLMDDLQQYIIRVKGVRPQFEAQNSYEMIQFETKEEAEYYRSAWERYEKEKARLEAMADAGEKGTGVMILVQFLIFRMAAEYCRKHHLAKRMYEAVSRGKAAVCAVNFKATIISVVKILVNDYNVPRDKISLVWGGGQTALTKKQKAKAKIKALSEKFEAMGVSPDEMLKDLDLDEVEDRIIEQLDPSLRLGPQSLDERQREIDKFQKGNSLYYLYTFRAGGVGLSSHHTDEHLPKDKKCRRKESGYVVEEDIPKIPTRPRETFVAPTYSAIELVQGLGRAPRLTSLSHTKQTLIFYSGTIEEDVAYIVSRKLSCLSRVVRMRESWEDVIVGRSRTQATQSHVDSVPADVSGKASDENGLLDGEGEEEE